MTGNPLYCRLHGVEGDLIEYEEINHREDGSEWVGAPWRLPIGGFIEGIVGEAGMRPAERAARRRLGTFRAGANG